MGKRQRRGAQPNTCRSAGGKIIRDIVSQLRKNGYVENYARQEGSTLGLLLTKLGRGELDKVATKIMKNQ
jgi:ribosomal protein S19E (S16A)